MLGADRRPRRRYLPVVGMGALASSFRPRRGIGVLVLNGGYLPGNSSAGGMPVESLEARPRVTQYGFVPAVPQFGQAGRVTRPPAATDLPERAWSQQSVPFGAASPGLPPTCARAFSTDLA